MSQSLDYQSIVTAILLASSAPLDEKAILALFEAHERPDAKTLKQILQNITQQLLPGVLTLQQSASGWRLAIEAAWAPLVARLEEQRPARYSNALLETLAFIAYRQPVTRSDIEQARGVSLSPSILHTLLERQWIRMQGHRETPGHPALFVTTANFLDDFNLKSLKELPELIEAPSSERQVESAGSSEIETSETFDAKRADFAQLAARLKSRHQTADISLEDSISIEEQQNDDEVVPR